MGDRRQVARPRRRSETAHAPAEQQPGAPVASSDLAVNDLGQALDPKSGLWHSAKALGVVGERPQASSKVTFVGFSASQDVSYKKDDRALRRRVSSADLMREQEAAIWGGSTVGHREDPGEADEEAPPRVPRALVGLVARSRLVGAGGRRRDGRRVREGAAARHPAGGPPGRAAEAAPGRSPFARDLQSAASEQLADTFVFSHPDPQSTVSTNIFLNIHTHTHTHTPASSVRAGQRPATRSQSAEMQIADGALIAGQQGQHT